MATYVPGGCGSVSAAVGTAAAPVAMPNVVVWEWQTDTGHWRPYEPAVCRLLEQETTTPSVGLVKADQRLGVYVVDKDSMEQLRTDTGTVRSVRRKEYPPDSAPGRGVVWQWWGDCAWSLYDMDTCYVLEAAYISGAPSVDLLHTLANLPYTIDFRTMTQTRQETGYTRKIQRVQMPVVYPLSGNYSYVGTGKMPSPTYVNGHVHCNTTLVPSTSVGGSNKRTHSASSAVAPPSVSGVKSRNGINSKLSTSTNGMTAVPPAVGTALPPNGGARPRARSTPALVSGGQPTTVVAHNRHAISHLTHAVTGMTGLLMSPALPVRLTHCTGPILTAPPSVVVGMTGLLMSPALPVRLTHCTGPILSPPHVSKMECRPVQGVPLPKKLRRKSSKTKNSLSGPDVLKKYSVKMKEQPPDEDCPICCENLRGPSGYDATDNMAPTMVTKLQHCNHVFHGVCLLAMYNSGSKDGSLQCPTCKTIYGEKCGNQPPGTMDYHVIPYPLPGYVDCHTIRIIYTIPHGIQGPDHPTPGKKYTARGFPRLCYLPDTEKGRKVLQLLIKAWERRLIFTIGRSTTTGEDNTVTWNEIHHKTEFGSNVTGHGYPDPEYLDNVISELAAHGVTE
ncbi:LOW QUALITY PROTEIN: E3 ubiquitin-protein ligase DTX1-like [Branchiostoma lanceolatum]|uniref:LOW QUALITY PROTEIN: E3 ubiquitin-protein ligase DTX1-like n=1 Tax=Branchiostoma lanceolatum TaxID=7740 RepID=UPI003452BCA3